MTKFICRRCEGENESSNVRYRYVEIDNHTVLVDPRTRKIVKGYD